MDGADIDNAQAAADTVRKAYNPADQWIAFGTIGPSQPGSPCVTAPAPSLGTANHAHRISAAGCRSPSAVSAPRSTRTTRASAARWHRASPACSKSPGTVVTDLADPIPMAAYELLNNGRRGRHQGDHPDDRRPAEQLGGRRAVHTGVQLLRRSRTTRRRRPRPKASRSSRSASASTAATTSTASTVRARSRASRRPSCSPAWPPTPSTRVAPVRRTTTATTTSASPRRPARARTCRSCSRRRRTPSPAERGSSSCLDPPTLDLLLSDPPGATPAGRSLSAETRGRPAGPGA